MITLYRKFITTLMVCAAVFVISAPSQAQIIGIEVKGPKAIKRYKKNIIDKNGLKMIIGETYDGIWFDKEKNSWIYNGNGPNILFVADPKNPEKVAYRFKRGELTPSSSKGQVSINGADIKGIHVLFPDQSLMGLAKEYTLRQEQLEELEAERKKTKKGTVEWFAVQERLVVHLGRLETWLRETTFPDAADEVVRDIRKERKVKLIEGVEVRALRAKDSIEKVPTPALLESAAEEHGGGKYHFRVHQSQHVRITHCVELVSDSVAVHLAELAERLIEGFRVDLMDPYRSESFLDHIPDNWFQEFYLGPDDLVMFEKIYEEYYALNWGQNRERSLSFRGQVANVSSPLRRLNYWRLDSASDLDGYIAHGLGHTLAELHYHGGLNGMQQDWLGEAVGYYLSLEYLGRNNVTCYGHYDPEKDRYGKSKRDKDEKVMGDKKLRMGLRDFFTEHALSDGPRIDKLISKISFELNDADLCKAWSFYEFLVKSEGIKGQLFLRAACRQAVNRITLINSLREDGATLYDLIEEDFYKWIDERWRTWVKIG
ncbi:MAG: hypothetical protein OSB14_11915 [Planctomycetota bacterium]|nr:hypothetical protein [Planctomycetota bacterium]